MKGLPECNGFVDSVTSGPTRVGSVNFDLKARVGGLGLGIDTSCGGGGDTSRSQDRSRRCLPGNDRCTCGGNLDANEGDSF